MVGNLFKTRTCVPLTGCQILVSPQTAAGGGAVSHPGLPKLKLHLPNTDSGTRRKARRQNYRERDREKGREEGEKREGVAIT